MKESSKDFSSSFKRRVLDDAWLFFDMGEYHSAVEVIKKGKEVLKRKQIEIPPEWEIMMSRIYQELGLLSEGWKCLKKAEMLAVETDYNVLASIYFNRGRILQLKERHKRAIEMYETARRYYTKSGNRRMVGRCLFNIGLILSDLKKYKRAVTLMKESLLIEDTPYTRQFYHLNMGYIEAERKRWGEAEKHFKGALRFSRMLKISEIELRALAQMGHCELRKKNYRKALQFYENALSVLENIMLPFPSPEITRNFMELRPSIIQPALFTAFKIGDLKKAFYLSARSKGLTLVEKTRCHRNFSSDELNEIAVQILKSRKKPLPPRWWENNFRKLPVHIAHPAKGECFMDFYRTGNQIGVMVLTKSGISNHQLENRDWLLLKRISSKIEDEILNYGPDAMIENEVEEIRSVFQKILPQSPIRKIMISPTGFLHTLPWQSIFPEFEVAICPSFLKVHPKPQRPSLTFLCMLCAEELVWARREFSTLKKLFPDGIFLSGKKLNKKVFFELAPYARYIHIIAHSSSALKGGEAGIELPDGELVSVSEISILPMKGSLVSLGVCASARGKIERLTDEVLSIAYAFLLAGVKRVIASPFPLDDKTAFQFFVNLYSSKAPSWERKVKIAYLTCWKRGLPLAFSGTFSLYRNLW